MDIDAIIPGGSAVGPYWQYRLERDGQFTAWRDWNEDPEVLAFTVDPGDNGNLKRETRYWLYARNPFVPSGKPGAVDSELAAPIEINAAGQVVIPSVLENSGSGAGGSGANQIPRLDVVTERSDFAPTAIDPDYVASYEPHPVKTGFFLIRALSIAKLWGRLLAKLEGLTRQSLIDKLALTLGDLVDLVTNRNLVVWSDTNNIIRRSSSYVTNFIVHQWIDPSGNVFEKLRSGIDADGFAGISDDAGRRIGFRGENAYMTGKGLQFNGLSVEFKSARTLSNTTGRMVLQSGDPSQVIGFLGPKAAGEGYDDVVFTKAQVASALFPDLLPLIVAAGTALTGGVDGSHVAVAIGCIEEEEPGLSEQDFVITHFQFGSPIAHGLKVGGANIMPTALDPHNRNALDYVDLSFDGTTSFTLTPRDAEVAADADFYVKLNLRRILS